MACPKCESDDWKSASFVYKSGISNININTSTIGAGAGIGTGGIGIGGGLASSSSDGTQQTRLSFETTPPIQPKNNAGTTFWIIAIIISMIAGNKMGSPTGLIVIISACVWYYTSIAPRVEDEFNVSLRDYNEKLFRWESTKVCQRCGQLYFSEVEA